ncbi:MAG TPA: trypsin-like serine protease [Actinomycetota bacterium]|nr:trypsin-like serine protease [Actinomycetota bacterium]
MVRRGVMLAAIALLTALALAAPARAITYGMPDGNGHPEAGALLAPQAYSDGTWAACSGTLISPTVFLTAAHCDLGVSRVAVTFDSTYDPGHRDRALGDLARRPQLHTGPERPS